VAKNKRKQTVNPFLLLVLILLVSAAVIFYFSRTRFVRYPAFGIDIPTSFSIHGIDVSHYQADIDWEAVKAMQIKKIKIGFSFIKATEGSDNEDRSFDSNWRDARKAGITRGAYHFFNPYRNGKEQAQNFISTVKLKPGDLPPVLDIEQSGNISKENLQERVGDWLAVVEQHYKVKPIIYTGAVFYSNFLSGKFDHYPLWVAHYLVKDKPRVKRNWAFWQHNEAGHVNGIDAFVDFNVFNGDSTDFKNLLVK
jgi:lysozyme